MDRIAAGEEVILTRHGRPKIRMLPADQPTTLTVSPVRNGMPR
jgi:antitoxin (DNA-binding transcriptional repressor) of toxin-antitoxin stability system